MDRTAARAAAALTASVLILAACSAADTLDAGPSVASVPRASANPAPTPAATGSQAVEPTPAPVADLVLMGDSVLLQAGPSIQQLFEEGLGVTLTVHDWINPDLASYQAEGRAGGERSADLLVRVRTDDQLRADLLGAEVVVFDVPFGILNDECPDPAVAASELEACWTRVLPGYRADVGAILEEVVALRDPAVAIVRATDVWQFLWPTFQQAGTYDVVRPQWQAMNALLADAAARHGIPLVHAYELFTGPDGERDPVGAGDVMLDELHLTGQGVGRFVDELAGLGFGTAGSNPAATPRGDRGAPSWFGRTALDTVGRVD